MLAAAADSGLDKHLSKANLVVKTVDELFIAAMEPYSIEWQNTLKEIRDDSQGGSSQATKKGWEKDINDMIPASIDWDFPSL